MELSNRERLILIELMRGRITEVIDLRRFDDCKEIWDEEIEVASLLCEKLEKENYLPKSLNY